MFVAWFMTISLFLICYYATVTIINGLKEKDKYDLAILHSQIENMSISNEEVRKQAV
ncbi:MAG: hypothetical protein ACQEXB_06070 [Bacillota bacterium]